MAGNARILTFVLLLCLCICLKTNMMINDDDKAETDVDFCLQEKLERLEEGILGDLGRQVLDAMLMTTTMMMIKDNGSNEDFNNSDLNLFGELSVLGNICLTETEGVVMSCGLTSYI